MNCCSECFSSSYLKDIINRYNTSGNCDFCSTKGSNIYNPSELTLFFKNILGLYVPNEKGKSLDQQIDVDFPNKIFSNKIHVNKQSLLKAIIDKEYESYSELFNSNVLLAHNADPTKKDGVKPLQITWDQLTEEIKYVNRFHLQNTLDLSKLEKLLKRYLKTIKKGRKFYRARISSESGFTISEMMNPPREKAKSGRANPSGISYLYLADQPKTTLHETRASLFDYVTIGEFRLLENIDVINLKGDTYDPVLLAEDDELEDFLIHESFINSLEIHLSKPRRRSDNELDYLPTQYLSEFIKSIGFAGVEFQSSLYSEGYNLAIFSPEKFECLSTEVCEVNGIELNHRVLST